MGTARGLGICGCLVKVSVLSTRGNCGIASSKHITIRQTINKQAQCGGSFTIVPAIFDNNLQCFPVYEDE